MWSEKINSFLLLVYGSILRLDLYRLRKRESLEALYDIVYGKKYIRLSGCVYHLFHLLIGGLYDEHIV